MQVSVDVLVAGGGIAGLTAAVEAARAGATVLLVESHRPGGRARSDVRRGFTFNRGPHALYDDGPGRAVLDGLGVRVTGAPAPVRGAHALRDGRLFRLPGSPATLLTTDLLTGRGRLGAARVLASLRRAPDPGLASESARAWSERVGGRTEVVLLLQALLRLSTYAGDLDALSADAAVGQLRVATGGVTYLDGGWQSIVDGLADAAVGAGVELVEGGPVGALDVSPDGVRATVGDTTVAARSVVLAVGGPGDVGRLLPGAVPADLGPSVEAACVDYGLDSPPPVRFILGIDEPVYFSQHAPGARLAPDGSAVVCALRYGSTGREAADGLDRLLGLAGVDRSAVVERRVLPSMTVAHALPRPGHGLAARPAVRVPGVPACFLAGDWVGPVGLLADAALSSGAAAGREAARR